MQTHPARHWLRTLVPDDASCPAADAPEPVKARTTLQQAIGAYTAGLTATLAFIA
ncbi:hypothetical protein V5740_02500 [Croceibacterium sp. TMG7-5b_MA50]|uniref:hypothetical protein n=1 Tax=Croceibacterium sp. TMG7-5b_MA50 TaxID=3121290 RepID=UPI0032217ACB